MSPNGIYRINNFQEGGTYCGLFSSLQKQKRNSNSSANESANTEDKDEEFIDDEKDANDCCDGKMVSNSAENDLIYPESTINSISDEEETYDYVNQSNNNAANDVSNATMEYALPEPEKKPAKFLQLIREARAANMIPPSLPVPSYSWEKKEVTEEGDYMVLPTRKPKKRDEKAPSPSEAETTSTANNAINEDIDEKNKSKTVPSLQDVIEKMQKVKEVEAQLRAKKERKQLDETKDDPGKSRPSVKSMKCEKDSVTLNYKERRRLRKEKEIEEAREELLESARNALKDRLEFNKSLKSAQNSENISKTLFGISTEDKNHPSISSREAEKYVGAVENVADNVSPLQSDDRGGDNSNVCSNRGLKVDEKMVNKQPGTSGRDSSSKCTKESENKMCKKKKRKKKHSSKYSNRDSAAASVPWGQQNCPVVATTGALQTIPNLSLQQPILVPVPICMSCCGVPQVTQPIRYNYLNRSWNPRVHRNSSSTETCTSSDSDCESCGQNSKRRPKLGRNKWSCSESSSFSDSSASFETESAVSPTNSTFSMSPSNQKCFSYTTSSSTSYDTTSECSALYSSSSNSDNDFS